MIQVKSHNRAWLTAQCMPFSSAHTPKSIFCDKKCRILTFRDKTDLSCSLQLSQTLSGSFWISYASVLYTLSCSELQPVSVYEQLNCNGSWKRDAFGLEFNQENWAHSDRSALRAMLCIIITIMIIIIIIIINISSSCLSLQCNASTMCNYGASMAGCIISMQQD